MCGKSVRRTIDVIAHHAGAVVSFDEMVRDLGDYTPGSPASIVLTRDSGRIILSKTWGYEIMDKLVYNARSESYLQKSSFKDNSRCLVPTGGFYEGGHLFVPTKADDVLFMAGLWKGNRFVVLTQDAAPTKISSVYHRAPILLEPTAIVSKWLDNGILPKMNMDVEKRLHESLYRSA